jgi:Na+/H+-dicarboxylate symporter
MTVGHVAPLPRSLFARYLDSSDATRLSAAFLLGALAGWMIGPRVAALSVLGDLLVRLLTVLVLPLLVCTIVGGIGSINPVGLGRVGLRSVMVYLILAVFAAAVGISVALIVRPGVGVTLPNGGALSTPLPSSRSLAEEWIPDNIAAAFVQGQYLGIALLTIPFAFALATLRDSEHAESMRVVYRFFDGCGRLSQLLLRWVMYYAPIGIFALTAVAFGLSSGRTLGQFGALLLAVYVAQLAIGVLLGFVIAARMPSGVPVSRIREVIVAGFATGSSAATLPLELKAAEQQMRIPLPVLSFTLPLGVAISKAGSAAYVAVVIAFTANAAGVPLTPRMIVLAIVLAALGSVATPAGAGGALLILGFVFAQAHLPLAAIGVVAAVPFAGRLNTPVNSLGRLATTTVVARMIGEP